MIKKIILIMCSMFVLFLLVIFISTGRARTDVFLYNFSLSDDTSKMTLKVGVSSSSGFIRKIKRTSGSTNYYFTFYSTFGFNNSIGSKDTFEINIDKNCDEIYFYTGKKGYKKVLEKDVSGTWKIVNNKNDILEIVDKTKSIEGFTCDMMLEKFYEDSKYVYYYLCIMSDYVVVKYQNGSEETVKEALNNGTITISNLDEAGIKYYREEK